MKNPDEESELTEDQEAEDPWEVLRDAGTALQELSETTRVIVTKIGLMSEAMDQQTLFLSRLIRQSRERLH